MTTDEFNARYTLQNQIAHGKSRSFTARESGGERAVMVHFLTEDRHPPGSAIAGLVERLSPQDRAKVIEILSVNLSTAVVTETLELFDSFDAWLQGRLAETPTPPAAPRSPAPAATGEFTSLFEPPAAPLPRPPAAPAAPAASAAPAAGEFTSMFQPPAVSLPTPPPAPAPARAPAPASAPAVPEATPRGNFTELFTTPPEAKPSPHPIPRPGPIPAAPPVEILSVRLPLSQPAPRPAAPAPMPAWPSAIEQSPAAPLAPPVVPPVRSPVLPDALPRPRAGEPIIKPPPRDQVAAPSPVPGWSGESDYTRQLRPAPPPLEAAPPVAPPPAAAAPGGGSRSLVPLLLVLNVLVIIATGLIVYFALKRR